MPYRAQNLPCPACSSILEPRTLEGVDKSTCPKGCGVWLSHQPFFEKLRIARPESRLTELMVHNDGTERRPCSVCGEAMEIAWIDFLQLDQCERHGIWFDAGELDRALHGDNVPHEIKRVVAAANKTRERRQKND